MSKPIIQVQNLSKQYRIGAREEAYATFRESLAGAIQAPFKRLRRNGSSEDDTVWALNDISFEVNPGDVVGIIGRNGAGKSTLLKVLSRITEPTKGSIKLYGRVASLLEVGTGFHPELTGRENIFLNGAILGMARREIERKFDEIVEFAEVAKFIDTPVKRYSSGMYLRLAFAVAAHLESEVLIVDEVLAVGDVEFQKKCFGKMGEVSRGEGRTVLLVSHNLTAIQSFCESSMLLNKGQLVNFGSTSKILGLYASKDNKASRHYFLDEVPRSRGMKSIIVKEVMLDADNYYPHSSFEITIKLKHKDLNANIRNINLAVFIFDSISNTLYHLSTLFDEQVEVPFSEESEYSFKIKSLNLNPGNYSVGIWLQGNGIEQDYIEDFVSFEVQNGNIYNAVNPTIVSLVQKEFEFHCR
jgi:lipopolysaccharide transport system ATP-binding protein